MTDVPLTLVPEQDDPRMFLPFASVAIDGVELEALVDSGASRSQVVHRPGLVVQHSATQDSVGAFGAPTQHVGRSVVSCRLAGLDAGAVEVHVVDGDLPGQLTLIGQDVLGQFRCLYRLADAVLMLNPDPPAHTGPIHVGTRGHVYLEASWDDVDTAASGVFDSGASVTVVHEGFARRHSELFALEGTGRGGRLRAVGGNRDGDHAGAARPR